ncbi:MAG: hypothetical protein M9939_11540 [Mesorhizobium sp.]|nr:hypothetical protein [Mesorhizobium sp.]MCO5161764.1 hypothetical protein [Mesorhizobium sp.]
MGDPTNMPPLSGEIMAGDPPRGGQPQGAAADAVDADFVTIPRSPAIPSTNAPPGAENVLARPSPPLTGMDLLKETSVPANRSRRAGIGFWATGLTAAAAAFWMSGGHTLSRHLPVIRGEPETVRIAGLTSRIAATATGPRLFIDGEVRNTARGGIASPELTIDVTAADGVVTRYRLATGAGRMASGETRRFSSRLDAPESGVRTVAVMIDRKGRD